VPNIRFLRSPRLSPPSAHGQANRKNKAMRSPTRNIRHAGYFLLILGAVFILVLLLLSPGNSQASSPPSLASFNGKIAFMSDNFIYTVNPDGSGELELSTDGINFSPAWSPDGTRIAMSRRSPSETTGFFIYVMNANGSGLQKKSIPVVPAKRPPPGLLMEAKSPFAVTATATRKFT
jgi:WD40-like Beta Propeller Repeat